MRLSPKIQPINTVKQPMALMSVGPTQAHLSVLRAAGRLPISTVIEVGGIVGPPYVRHDNGHHGTDVHIGDPCSRCPPMMT